MSILRVNNIFGTSAASAPNFSKGIDVRGAITGNVNITGVCTATNFVGNGSLLTNTGGVLPAKAYALLTIL